MPVVIDFDGIDQRILALPMPAGDYSQLAGRRRRADLLPGAAAGARRGTDGPRGATLKRFDLSKRKSETVLPGVGDYHPDAPTARRRWSSRRRRRWSIVDVTGTPPAPGKGKLKIDAIEVRIDPRAEWQQIFDEAWRINRDYFYDPQHARRRLAGDARRSTPRSCRTWRRAATWTASSAGCSASWPSATATSAPANGCTSARPVPGGLLGADYEIANGRYRFKKVYGGLNWSPELRSPLTAPGRGRQGGRVPAGGARHRPEAADRGLLALREHGRQEHRDHRRAQRRRQGQPHRHRRAAGQRGRPAQPRLGRGQPEEGPRGDRAAGWPTSTCPTRPALGHAYFKRYFFPQADKEAIIVDERFNGGGQVADYYIDHLRRPFTAMWATRYGEDLKTPGAAIHGPKVMLIDETAGSGGDLLPWMFRKYKLGPLVGKRTWGGLVGILGFPVLMDGGAVTAPNLAIWTKDGFVVENEGVPPDVEVEQVARRRDRRQGPATGEGDRDRAERAGEESAAGAEAAAVPGAGAEVGGTLPWL